MLVYLIQILSNLSSISGESNQEVQFSTAFDGLDAEVLDGISVVEETDAAGDAEREDTSSDKGSDEPSGIQGEEPSTPTETAAKTAVAVAVSEAYDKLLQSDDNEGPKKPPVGEGVDRRAQFAARKAQESSRNAVGAYAG